MRLPVPTIQYNIPIPLRVPLTLSDEVSDLREEQLLVFVALALDDAQHAEHGPHADERAALVEQLDRLRLRGDALEHVLRHVPQRAVQRELALPQFLPARAGAAGRCVHFVR